MEYKNDDFVLKVQDFSQSTESIIHKYDAFLNAITDEKFNHIREAVREAVRFFVSNKYPTTEFLAREHYLSSTKMRSKYPRIEEYLSKFEIPDKKSVSIDLATGTGKSWVIYSVAIIMLGEGFVDKVLVLCPSLTIEEELKKKFIELSGNGTYTKILQEIGALYPSPEIKSANDPILTGDICVENIHAVYDRTGSSIRDSFLNKGDRTIVINDEAHHIYSPEESSVRRWKEFLTNDEYGFQYLLGLTGTAYISNSDNDYFHDIIFRYGIKKATENGIIKTIDYITERSFENDEDGYDLTYMNHSRLKEKYSGLLKPITIVITASIFDCINEWDILVKDIAEREGCSEELIAKKVIWVTSGLPSNDQEKEIIKTRFPDAEKIRKENLQLLKTVDDDDNPVEWIISVAMLTEGWDVKNVFQIVPNSHRAFNSKLLIAQVLGRGLRVPKCLEPPVLLTINNHTKWTSAISKLYQEVLEIENRVSWGFCELRRNYLFHLFNFEYSQEQYATESKEKPADEPNIRVLHPQKRTRTEYFTYSQSGTRSYEVEVKGNLEIEDAAREMSLFFRDKDPKLAKDWPITKIKDYIVEQLDSRGYDSSFISKENLTIIKQSFGPMLRSLGTDVPRIRLVPDTLIEVSIDNMRDQFFSEDSIKFNGYLFFDDLSIETLSGEEKEIIGKYLSNRMLLNESNVLPEIAYLLVHLFPIENSNFITPLNFVYVSYRPEKDFVKNIFRNSNLFMSFIKSPDVGFYEIPYSYKPTEIGSTHVARKTFNPDFFLVVKDTNDILAVEIKDDSDTSQENKAKLRDAIEHFKELNSRLLANNQTWQYYFYFLSPTNYDAFFEAIKAGSYKRWKSELMQELE